MQTRPTPKRVMVASKPKAKHWTKGLKVECTRFKILFLCSVACSNLGSDPEVFAAQNMSNLAWAAGTLAIDDDPAAGLHLGKVYYILER